MSLHSAANADGCWYQRQAAKKCLWGRNNVDLCVVDLAVSNRAQYLCSCKGCCNLYTSPLSRYPTPSSECLICVLCPHPPFWRHGWGAGVVKWGLSSRTIWRIYDTLLAATLEFTLPLGDRCSHSLCLFITQTHNNVQPQPPALWC